MKIFLVGFMGSGKTSIGKRLAKAIGYDFIDLDNLIESNSNTSINDIFALRGEEYFRTLEQETLAELESNTNLVVATGGGTPCFHDNMEFMNTNGATIYLRLNNEVIYERLVNSRSKRPLLKDLSDDELKMYIADKLSERASAYQQAQHTIDAAHITKATEQISSLLQQLKLL